MAKRKADKPCSATATASNPIPAAEATAPSVAVRAESGRAMMAIAPETIANSDKAAPLTNAFVDPIRS